MKIEDWKEKIIDYIKNLPDNRAEIKFYQTTYQKLVDAGSSSAAVQRPIKIIEVWYR